MEEASQPLVSIGMPVRNNEATLALAIRSILEQTYTNWELLLIDDGSSDGTLRVMRGFTDERIRIFSDGLSLGLPDRLNQAIDASRGEYFARMDGDDVSYPRRLGRQVDYLRHHPQVDLVGAWAIRRSSAASSFSDDTDIGAPPSDARTRTYCSGRSATVGLQTCPRSCWD